MTEDEIGKQVVDVAVQIHQAVGPGLLETVYEAILAHELRRRGRALPAPLAGFKNTTIESLAPLASRRENLSSSPINTADEPKITTMPVRQDKNRGLIAARGAPIIGHGPTLEFAGVPASHCVSRLLHR